MNRKLREALLHLILNIFNNSMFLFNLNIYFVYINIYEKHSLTSENKLHFPIERNMNEL